MAPLEAMPATKNAAMMQDELFQKAGVATKTTGQGSGEVDGRCEDRAHRRRLEGTPVSVLSSQLTVSAGTWQKADFRSPARRLG